MKVTVDGLEVEGTEDEILRLINLMRQNGSKPIDLPAKQRKVSAPRSGAPRHVGPREAEVVRILRAYNDHNGIDQGLRSPELAGLIEWGDAVKDDDSSMVSRTSAILSNLQKKRLVVRPKGQSRWFLTSTGLNCKLVERGHLKNTNGKGDENE